MRTVIPSSTDWLTSADFNSGTVLVEGRLAEIVHLPAWDGCRAAYGHVLDPRPWDYSGFNNHATRTGGVADAPERAWTPNGTTGYLDGGTRAATDLTSAFTISGWMRHGADTGATRILVAKRITADDYPFTLLFVSTAQRALRLDSGNGGTDSSAPTTSTYTPGELAHFAVTRSGTTVNFYKNGVADAGNPQTVDVGASDADARFLIGAQDAGSGAITFWNGMLLSLRLHNRALSQAEIAPLAQRPHAEFECRVLPRVFSFV